MSEEAEPYDLIGVGIDPFNASLAALAEPVSDLSVLFLEAKPRFAWNAGLESEGGQACIPMLSDLVTLVNPTSRWSFLAYLRANDLLFPFLSLKRFHISHHEWDRYCRWVVDSLPSCLFDRAVQSVRWDVGDRLFHVEHMDSRGRKTVERAVSVVLGAGPVATVRFPTSLDRVFWRPHWSASAPPAYSWGDPERDAPVDDETIAKICALFHERRASGDDACGSFLSNATRGDVPPPPAYLDPLVPFIEWEPTGCYGVDSCFRVALTSQISGSLFVHKAEIHTPGIGRPNVGLGAWRSAIVINALLGRDQYHLSDLPDAYEPGPPVGAVDRVQPAPV